MASRRRELTQVSGLDTAASGKPSQRFALPKGVSLAEVAASDRQSGADDVGRFVGGEEEYGCRLLVQCGVPLEV
jgi:hypothetical protein